MTELFRIRRARSTLEEASAIAEILRKVASERIHSAITNPWTAEQQWEHLTSLSERAAFHIAIAPNGTIAGCQSLEPFSPYLDSMSHVAQVGTFLLPEYRGQGAGRAMFAETKAFAIQAAYRKIAIQVRGQT